MISAIRRDQIENAHGVNIRKMDGAEGKPPAGLARVLKNTVPNKNPEVVCLVIGGNENAHVGMFEHAVPFSVGEATMGAAPADPSRHFIPYQVMKSHFERRVSTNLFRSIFKQFPNSAKVIANTPPPVGEWEHISNNLGAFKDRLTQGPAPLPLRLQLYRIQSLVLKEEAERQGAQFVDVPDNVATEEGFLKPEFYNPDPTHGNLAYGRLMLAKVMKEIGAAA